MKRPSRTGSKTKERKARDASPARARKATKAKRSSGSVPSNDLKDARAQQAATAEILKVIASSPSDVQPVFEAIASSAKRLLGGFSTTVYRIIGDVIHLVALTPTSTEADGAIKAEFPVKLSEAAHPLTQVARGEPVQIADSETADPQTQRLGRARGWRSVMFTPLMNKDTPIGFITVTRVEPGAFAPHHIQLLRTFADQAVIAIENTRLFEEVQAQRRDALEALEHQTATSAILEVISRSPSDAQPVFDAIVQSAARLCEAVFSVVWRYDGELLHYVASHNFTPEVHLRLLQTYPKRPDRSVAAGRAILDAAIAEVPDMLADRTYAHELAIAGDWRASVAVPMMHNGVPIGAISLGKAEARPFSPRQIQLLTTFASQAVIAIENVRLFEQVQKRTDDLSESLRQQTATADVLKVISRSAFDLQTVLDTLTQSAARLSDADMAAITRQGADGSYHHATNYNLSVDWVKIAPPIKPERGSIVGRALLTGKAVQIADVLVDPEYAYPEQQKAAGYRTLLAVPLLRSGQPIGVLFLGRKIVQLFTDKQIELVSTFADQAVIAIENTRLINETREALERQTASAEVLQVISSSPGDLKPVFDQMLGKAMRLCEAQCGFIYQMEQGAMRAVAEIGVPPAFAEYRRNNLHTGGAATPADVMRATRKPAHVHDARDSEPYRSGNPNAVAGVDLGGARTVLYVPMIRNDDIVGVINVYRQEVRPFTEEQISLLENFASQAVIAIENARLFNETREALERQTATTDVLKVISQSSVDLETVLATLVQTVARLCRADQVYMFHQRHGLWHLVADCGLSPEARAFFRTNPFTPGRGSTSGRAALERRAILIPDVLQDSEYTLGEGQETAGYRTTLGIPLLREDTLIGVYSLTRTRVEPFTDKEIALATSFADQAVIAIENARLFDELRDRQAELRVTFDNMGDGVAMFGADRRLAAWNRNLQEMLDLPNDLLIDRPSFAELFRFLAARGEFGSADLEAELSRSLEDSTQEMRYERTRPDGRIIEVRRNSVPEGGFVLIYADVTERKRAEEAIRRARDAAERALRDLQTAQDRLVQTEKLASLGQLTAGIAHEIKNPLNFVNNFAALSAELTDELNDVLKHAELADKIRGEVRELTQMLRSNLEKVVQHGKRADSIVKNMLLHSREGSGERRSADINTLVEESLNLAYHGARAEKSDFSITFERDLDPDAGAAEVYPQEVTRALLNLISNGFYAAAKRKSQADNQTFEPLLSASTRNLGNRVEIRVRDNGTGVPHEVRQKIFNPFFTTKPAGEGTGLGLSMTHDIIVKQHGGSITVETEPGVFTEFIITLPRGGTA